MGQYVPENYRIPVIAAELRSARLTRGLRLAFLAAAR